MILEIKRSGEMQLSKDFQAHEFDCPCGCLITKISTDLISALQRLRNILNCSIKITSGYRCQDHQDDLKLLGYETAKGISTHTLGEAVDIKTGVHTGIQLEESARKAGISSVGVGSNWIHMDMRPDVRRWEYKS